MESTGPKHRLSKLRIAFVFALVTIAAGAASYGYHLYRLAQDLQINKPQPQVERLARDLRRFYAQTRRFPANFIEINQRLWHTKPQPDYGSDGRRAWTKNYFYLYTKVNDETCAFWALPIGPQRHYAASFFVVLSPDWMRAWKREAMSDEEIVQVPAIPSPAILAEFKMQEMPSRVFSAAKCILPTTSHIPFDSILNQNQHNDHAMTVTLPSLSSHLPQNCKEIVRPTYVIFESVHARMRP